MIMEIYECTKPHEEYQMFVWLSFSVVHFKIGNYISWWIRDVVNPIRM